MCRCVLCLLGEGEIRRLCAQGAGSNMPARTRGDEGQRTSLPTVGLSSTLRTGRPSHPSETLMGAAGIGDFGRRGQPGHARRRARRQWASGNVPAVAHSFNGSHRRPQPPPAGCVFFGAQPLSRTSVVSLCHPHMRCWASLRVSLLLCLTHYRSISASAHVAKGHVSSQRIAYPASVVPGDAASLQLGGVHDRCNESGSCTRCKELDENLSVMDSHAPAHGTPSKHNSIGGRHMTL